MNKLVNILVSITIIINACSMNEIKPPVADKKPKELTIHNHTRIDNYYWLNDRDNPDVIDYLKKENEYTSSILKDTEQLQDTLFNEIIARIKQTDMSVPYFKNGYYYYVRYEEGKEYAVHCRKKETLAAEEEVILDVNQMAEGCEYFNLASYSISPDNKIVAYGVDTLSRRIYTIHFKSLETGEFFEDKIENTTGRAVWANDNSTTFYSLKDEQTLRSSQVFSYKLGDEKSSKLIFEEKDETYSTYVYKSRSNKYIIIGSSSTLSDEYRILDADSPEGEFKVFQERERGLEYGIGHVDDKFYVITNLNARNFQLMITDVDKTTKYNWKPFIEHREDVFLEGFLSFKDFIVVHEREKGDQRLKVIHHGSNESHEIDFGDKPYTVWFGQNPEFNTPIIRLGYTSMTIPSSIYDYDLEKRTLELLKQQEVVGGYNADEYTSERVFATASDNTQVPITLVYKKATAKSKNTPLLLYGYGSYGHTIDPYFSSARLSLLDRGFIYAIAHIRGGQVMGRAWYEDGKMLSKKNTFTDFIACAEYLVENEYTSKEKIAAMGGSAGGLLTGAVMNLRPDLFNAVIAAVPFVDVVTTMLDESIPLTTGEYDEWGNPNEKEYYDYMLSYSPYDNVEEKDYPNVLVTTGLHDSQVQYWEPAKWVAKLRELKTDDNILLMHTNMEAGHGGASGRFRPYRETATEYAFLMKMLEIK